MTDHVRVKDKATGHEYTVRADRVIPGAHTVLDKPALAPSGEPAPVKYKTTVAKAAEEKKAQSGHQATTPKES